MADPPFTLPPEASDEGAMARLFINEAAGPSGADAATTVRAMGWMKRILINRLVHPAQFAAAGATRLTQIVQAHDRSVQFAGFSDYPTLGVGVARNIAAKLEIAADPKDRRQPVYLAFVQAAITAAQSAAPADPCPTGLYFWKTSGTVSPGGRSRFFQALGGNDFYTLPADFFGAHHPRAHASHHRTR